MDTENRTNIWFKTKSEDEIRWLDNSLFNFNEKFSNLNNFEEIIPAIDSILILNLSNQITLIEMITRIKNETMFYKIKKEDEEKILKEAKELIEAFKKLSKEKTEGGAVAGIKVQLTSPLVVPSKSAPVDIEKNANIKRIDPYHESIDE